jgi:hypothetical protein
MLELQVCRVRKEATRMGCKSPRSLKNYEGAKVAFNYRNWFGPFGLVFCNTTFGIEAQILSFQFVCMNSHGSLMWRSLPPLGLYILVFS